MVEYFDDFSKNYLMSKLIYDLLDDKIVLINVDIEEELQMVKEYLENYSFTVSILNNDKCELLKFEENDNIYLKKVLSICKSIDKYYKEITSFGKLLNNNTMYGLTLEQMYRITGADLNKDGNIKRLYDTIVKFDIIKDNDIQEIKRIKNKLSDIKLVSNYLKCKRFKDNTLFKNIKKDVNSNDVNLVLYKINGLLNNKYSLIPPLNISKYTDEFIKSEIWNMDISDNELMNICSNVNKQLNGDYELQYYKPTWKSILNIKKHKSLIRKNNILMQENKSVEKQVFSEFKENIENMNIYYHSFNFLKKVFDDNYIKDISKILTDQDEFEKFLQKASNGLSVYQNYRIIKKKLYDLTPIEKAFLDACCEIGGKEREVLELVNLLPVILLQKAILSIQEKEKVKIDNYRGFSDNLIKLLDYIKIKENYCNTGMKINNVYVNLAASNYEHLEDKVIVYNLNEIKTIYDKNNGRVVESSGNSISDEKILLSPIKEVKGVVFDLGLKGTNVIDGVSSSCFYKIYKNINSEKNIVVYLPNSSNDFNTEINELLTLYNLNTKIEYLWTKDLWENKDEGIKYLKAKLNNYFYG